MNLYNLTYLNANGYLNKFRAFLNNPKLTLNGLSAILKTLYKQIQFRQYKDDNGNLVLYSKSDLDYILNNRDYFLRLINNILDDWNQREAEKEMKPEIEDVPAKPDFRGEDDMEYQINNLINEKKMKSQKNIFITESQLNYIKENSEHFTDPNKVKIVCEFLNNNFQKGGISTMGEDGYPTTVPIVGLKGTDGQIIRNMSDKQLFSMLLDKFGKIYSDVNQVKKFLKQVMKDWYYDKISKEGLLSVNKY